MRRYLIEHGRDGTWDLIVADGQQKLELYRHGLRQTFAVPEFAETRDGLRLRVNLAAALARAAKDDAPPAE